MQVESTHKQITPKQLYNEFIKGKRPEYEYDYQADKPMQELNLLAEKYKQTLSLDDKKELLDKERKILYQELNHPELTLARNYSDISNLISTDTDKSTVKNLIDNFNLTALLRIESMDKPFESEYSKRKINTLNKLYNKTNENVFYGKENKTQLNHIKDWVKYYQDTPPTNTKIKPIRTLEDFKDALINGGKADSPRIQKHINKILKNKNVNPEYKRLAVWGAGKFRSNKFFGIIKEIALDTKEKDIKLREFAIHSTALYLKEKPDEVEAIMTSIERDKTIFAPLAKTINEKINGEYNKPQKALKGLTRKEKQQYQSLKKRYLYSDTKLNIHSENMIDKALLFYKKVLGHFVNSRKKCIITQDTYTKIIPEKTGERCFTNGIFNSGDFYDSFSGISNRETIVINKRELNYFSHNAIMGHECAHTLNRLFKNYDWNKLYKLYSNALDKDYVLDDYGKRNVFEYFAQGCEAYISEYKPHSTLLSKHSATNTRYELLTKDPDLFKFVKYCLKKYH